MPAGQEPKPKISTEGRVMRSNARPNCEWEATTSPLILWHAVLELVCLLTTNMMPSFCEINRSIQNLAALHLLVLWLRSILLNFHFRVKEKGQIRKDPCPLRRWRFSAWTNTNSPEAGISGDSAGRRTGPRTHSLSSQSAALLCRYIVGCQLYPEHCEAAFASRYCSFIILVFFQLPRSTSLATLS